MANADEVEREVVYDQTWTYPASGVAECETPSWKSFVRYVLNDMLPFSEYIWRGQRRASWPLEPTLDRLARVTEYGSNRYSMRAKHLEAFKFAARGRRGPNPPRFETDDDWWALGQHHGLATPLLDWAASPFVAAFFAYANAAPEQDEPRAVYALYAPSLEGWADMKARQENRRRKERLQLIEAGKAAREGLADLMLDAVALPEFVLVKPLSDGNERLVSQGGMFTRLTSELALPDWIHAHHVEEDGASLIKFILPNADREEAMKALNRMNINYLSLFPDLQGASLHTNMQASITGY